MMTTKSHHVQTFTKNPHLNIYNLSAPILSFKFKLRKKKKTPSIIIILTIYNHPFRPLKKPPSYYSCSSLRTPFIPLHLSLSLFASSPPTLIMPRHHHHDKRGGGNGPRKDPSREVKISKAASYVLRHGAVKEGLRLDESGYVNVRELVSFFFPFSFFWDFCLKGGK